ncbi:MAG: alpha/beta hydrolase, partial [Erysipelotrichaceae bacterium]|nr:alpha/beta hydrolase [Erysipelotrichaceae bacterium]
MKKVEKKELSFPSANGIDQIHVLAYLPAEEIKGYVQIVHDTYEHIGIYAGILESFAYRGYLAFGHDHMGHGRSAASLDDLGKLKGDNAFRNILTDTNAAFVLMFNEYPPKEVKKYKRTVIEKKGLFQSTKEVELAKPPLHALIGIGFGSAVV